MNELTEIEIEVNKSILEKFLKEVLPNDRQGNEIRKIVLNILKKLN